MFMKNCNKTELIVMLTYNDLTLKDAYDIFDECKKSKAKYWGFKGDGISFEQMKELFAYMKSYNKTTILEVVAYTEEECIKGAKMAIECNCDILMGTMFFDSINELCKKNNLKYMPFVGEITERPSILNGSVDEMIAEANNYLSKGVCGFDLLGYRYTGDATMLNEKFVAGVNAPVCIAGSVNSYERLDEIIKANPWAFTIGSAFFENKFGTTYNEQIDKVCNYIEEHKNA
ncbi:MAG: hypothetical protein LBB91_01825 [Clostridiales bacterium]|jgi:hypothetical protein|nr:hypothetical protein [Clostridiales bacterium]